MNNVNSHYLTQKKFDTLKAETKELKNQTIPAIAKRIDSAKQMGDLSENAEYHAAREEMAWAQSRLKELGRILDNAEIISIENKSKDIVDIGSKVVVEINNKEREYTIVGAQEADPAERKISNESPLGRAFLGRTRGESVQVEVPSGVQVYKIVSIN